MRRLAGIFILVLLSGFVCRGQSETSQGDDALIAKLTEYAFSIQAQLSIQDQCLETDYIISPCEDKTLKTKVATTLYRYFSESKLMGAENVAVHIYDKWFQSGELKMEDDMEQLQAKIFAEFNRQSLIGVQAEPLTLKNADSEEITMPGKGKACVIYFYDTDCAKCRIESVFLRNVLENHDFPIDFYAVYIGDKKEQWLQYNERNFSLELDNTKVFLLRDEDRKLEFQRKYGVLTTPKMFLVGADGNIIGRNLDSKALEKLLKDYFGEIDYGTDESKKFLDTVFEPFGSGITAQDVMSSAKYICAKTLEHGDTTLFRQMTGDLLYYLTNRREEGFRMATAPFVDEFILGKEDIWYRESDIMAVVSLAAMLKDLTSINTIGEKLPQVVLDGVLVKKSDVTKGKEGKHKSIEASKLKKTVLFFHSETCENCAKEKESLGDFLRANKGLKVFLVDIDQAVGQDDSILGLFDLSSTPYILLTGKDAKLQRKYFSMLAR